MAFNRNYSIASTIANDDKSLLFPLHLKFGDDHVFYGLSLSEINFHFIDQVQCSDSIPSLLEKLFYTLGETLPPLT